MFIAGLIANIWNVGAFVPRGAVWRATSFLLLAQVTGPCGSADDPVPSNAGDPAQYPSVGCTPDAHWC